MEATIMMIILGFWVWSVGCRGDAGCKGGGANIYLGAGYPRRQKDVIQGTPYHKKCKAHPLNKRSIPSLVSDEIDEP